jgi:hypothetical protein
MAARRLHPAGDPAEASGQFPTLLIRSVISATSLSSSTVPPSRMPGCHADSDDGVLYALKELSERLARREYRLLRALAELNIPAADVIVNPRGAFFLTRDAENISHWFTAHGLTGVRPEPGELASLLRREALIDH